MKTKKCAEFLVRITDESGSVLIEREVTRLPLKETEVIAKSIEFFKDPEPCMIHRSAVLKRVFMEFYDYFEKSAASGNTSVSWTEFPAHLRNMLEIPEGGQNIDFKQI